VDINSIQLDLEKQVHEVCKGQNVPIMLSSFEDFFTVTKSLTFENEV
jgi:hypothetical protein